MHKGEGLFLKDEGDFSQEILCVNQEKRQYIAGKDPSLGVLYILRNKS